MNRIVTTAPLNSPFQVSTKKLFSKTKRSAYAARHVQRKASSKIEDVVASKYIEDAHVHPCVRFAHPIRSNGNDASTRPILPTAYVANWKFNGVFVGT